jgi:hypothetical protein
MNYIAVILYPRKQERRLIRGHINYERSHYLTLKNSIRSFGKIVSKYIIFF